MKYTFKLVGYHTNSWAHIEEEIKIEAESEKEAVERAEEWCELHSVMGGYDWQYVDYSPREHIRYSRICPRCGYEYTAVDYKFDLPRICAGCLTDLTNVPIEIKDKSIY